MFNGFIGTAANIVQRWLLWVIFWCCAMVCHCKLFSTFSLYLCGAQEMSRENRDKMSWYEGTVEQRGGKSWLPISIGFHPF
jgi:hypothetical protein